MEETRSLTCTLIQRCAAELRRDISVGFESMFDVAAPVLFCSVFPRRLDLRGPRSSLDDFRYYITVAVSVAFVRVYFSLLVG